MDHDHSERLPLDTELMKLMSTTLSRRALVNAGFRTIGDVLPIPNKVLKACNRVNQLAIMQLDMALQGAGYERGPFPTLYRLKMPVELADELLGPRDITYVIELHRLSDEDWRILGFSSELTAETRLAIADILHLPETKG